MDILKKIYRELIKRRIIVIISAVVLIIIFLFFFRNNKESEYNLAIVERGSIREEVSVTGKIEAVESINLSFRATGNLSQVLIETGDVVKKGQILASLENNDLWAQLKQVQANLEAEEAKLEELKKGTRQETINIKQIELSKAEQDLNNYYQTVVNTLNDAYAKSEEAIKIDIQDIFSGAEAANSYVLSFDSCVTNEIASEAGYLRLVSERELRQWKDELTVISSSTSFEELTSAIQKAQEHLAEFRDFFNKLNNVLLADCSYSNPGLDTDRAYRADANHGRNLIITAISNVDENENNIISQNLLVKKIQNEFDLLLAGSSIEQIAVQEAKVKSAQANVSNYYALIEKTIIRAPIDGFIAKKEIKKGEIVLANASVISLMAEQGLQIKTYIPEVDVSKVKAGNSVLITLDAFPKNEFFGEVAYIDSAETIIDGVVYYKVKSTINTNDTDVKSGMTADIIIITGAKEDVLIIPRRAVIEKDGKNIVKIPVNGDFQEIKVQTGLVGSDGNIEIISGLKEGDKVITFIKK